MSDTVSLPECPLVLACQFVSHLCHVFNLFHFSVTPAQLPEAGKKSCKTSGRSTKKAKVERLPEQTPVLKEDKSSNSQVNIISLILILQR